MTSRWSRGDGEENRGDLSAPRYYTLLTTVFPRRTRKPPSTLPSQTAMSPTNRADANAPVSCEFTCHAEATPAPPAPQCRAGRQPPPVATKGEIVPKERNNPDFPLRGYATCGHCGKPLTGSWSQGRRQRYAYYHCPPKARCRKTNVRRRASWRPNS